MKGQTIFSIPLILILFSVVFVACGGATGNVAKETVDRYECEQNIMDALSNKRVAFLKDDDFGFNRIGTFDNYYQVSSVVGDSHESARYKNYDTKFQVYRFDYEQGIGPVGIDRKMYFVCDAQGVLLD